MKTGNAKNRFGKLKVAHATFALAMLAGVGGYGWHLYSLFRNAQVNLPQPQIEKLVKDMRLFHSRVKRFPRNFSEINDLIWHTRPMPDYGPEGRQARTRNYYYYYTRVDEQTCAIWALPIGPRRQDGASFFLVLTPGWQRTWRGKAIEEGAISSLPAIPQPDRLAELMMREQPARIR
jgi:hypothetical protein